MNRIVKLIHRFGGEKEGLTGELLRAGPNGKTSKVVVHWPLNGILTFSALTGREHGSPHGPWRLSDEDVTAFAAELGRNPSPPPTASNEEAPAGSNEAQARPAPTVARGANGGTEMITQADIEYEAEVTYMTFAGAGGYPKWAELPDNIKSLWNAAVATTMALREARAKEGAR